MGGNKVTDVARRLLIDIWHGLKKNGQKCTAQVVLDAANQNIKANGRNDIELPGLRKTQYILRVAEEKAEELSPAEMQIQQPWNLSTIDKHPMSPESIPAVLEVWRYCVNLGEPLTIRQAIWVSRLYAKTTDTIDLWLSASNYAQEEILSLLSGTAMRDFDLDSQITMNEREIETFKIPERKYQSMVSHGYSGKTVYVAEDGGILEEFLHSLPSDIGGDDMEYVANFAYYLISLIAELPSCVNYFPDLETKLIYLRQLSYLASVDNWHKFRPEEIRDIVVDLREWVVAAKTRDDDEYAASNLNPFPYENIRFGNKFHSTDDVNLHPVEIYQRVGYTGYLNIIWRRLV